MRYIEPFPIMLASSILRTFPAQSVAFLNVGNYNFQLCRPSFSSSPTSLSNIHSPHDRYWLPPGHSTNVSLYHHPICSATSRAKSDHTGGQRWCNLPASRHCLASNCSPLRRCVGIRQAIFRLQCCDCSLDHHRGVCWWGVSDAPDHCIWRAKADPFPTINIAVSRIRSTSSKKDQESIYQQFLSLLNVSTLQEARKLPSNTLIAANQKQSLMRHTQIEFTVLQLTVRLHLESRHNTNEGVLFADARVANDTLFAQFIHQMLRPDVQDSIVDYISDDRYPAQYDGSFHPFHLQGIPQLQCSPSSSCRD